MKTSQIFLFALLGCVSSGAQTNTFPASGNVGIGISSPNFALSISDQFSNISLGENIFINGYGSTGRISNNAYLSGSWNISDTSNWATTIEMRDTGVIEMFGTLTAGQTDWRRMFGFDAPDNIVYFPSGKVGIGTTNPISKLTINNGALSFTGSVSIPEASVGLHNTNFMYVLGGTAGLKLTDDSANGMTIIDGGNVGIGTDAPGTYKLAVNGNVRAKEVKVETGWSDFVFEKDYDLPTLEEVEEHIQDKGHLQEIPSAEEVAKHGILLGEMDSKLLQKIEELTLYTIAQEKRIKYLEKENETLKSITERMAKIEALLKTK